MNQPAFPSIETLFRATAPDLQSDASPRQTLPVAIEPAKPVHRIRRKLDTVGKHLENKVVVCETFDDEVAILVLDGFESSPQVSEVKLQLQRRYSKMPVKVYAHTAVDLLTYAKAHDDSVDTSRQLSSNYQKALEDMVHFAVENRASDITLDICDDKPASPVSFKIDGRQIRLPQWVMKTDRLEEIVNIAWQGVTGGSQSSFNKQVESQGVYSLPVGNRHFKLRFQSIINDEGPSVSLRLLEQRSVMPLANYGYLPSHLELLNRYKNSRSGFIVFSGKVDSGKTTSLSALIAMLPKHYKTFMLEDPVEIIIDGVYQITLARPVDGSGDKNYSQKLMALKRAAPDAISLGEVRDGLNAKAVADVGGMGILGLFTVHASSALHAPQKLWSESVGVPKDFLSSPGMFKLFVHQALVPRLCSCANPLHSLTEQGGVDQDGVFQDGSYWQQYIQLMETAFTIDASGMKVRNHLGCDECRRPYFSDLNGFAGRQLLAEMIEINKHYDLMRLIGQGDALGMYLHANTLKHEDISHPDMTNKTIVECGLYWALKGVVDPRDVEQATEPFANLINQPRYQ
jgi:type II secretory ATPase GspE/PulE/Tfp pilus assembly ATPase PilB-like protein